MATQASKASKATSKAVTVANTGKGLLISDLETIGTLWGTSAPVEGTKVRFIGALIERGFSVRAIADGATVRLGAKTPKGFNKSTVAIYGAVYKVMRDSAPAKGTLTPAQSDIAADMLLTIAGAQDTDGGAAKGLQKAAEAVKASKSGAGAIAAIRTIHKNVTDARSRRIATPVKRTPVIGAQGGKQEQEQEPGGKQEQEQTPKAPAPASDAITAASPARLIAELARRVSAKGFAILDTDRKSFDALAALVESVEVVKAKR